MKSLHKRGMFHVKHPRFFDCKIAKVKRVSNVPIVARKKGIT